MNNNNSRYSITSLFREYDEVKIPIIQRDYAQGRKSAKEVRKNFLNSIKDHLNNGLHLDFIYGSVEKHGERKILILLDGQQRITTLFLLYWYSAIKGGEIEKFQEIFCLEGENSKSKLRYEVRASSEEFLDDMVLESNIEFRKDIKLSEIIKDKNWFYLGWSHDPTISGMLSMLDDIDENFRNESKLFESLYNNDASKITFDFLELDNFGLTDDLYIKMNSRGKLLTPYENFKAKFEKLIEIYFEKKTFNEIAKKFEKEYIDIFWKYAKQNNKNKQDIAKLTDEYMYLFFYNLTLNLYALSNETNLHNNYRKLDDFVQENSLVSFFEKIYDKKEHTDRLIEFLDYLSGSKDIPEQVKSIVKENPTLWDRVRFYAHYLGIIEHKDDEHWCRVLKNLINNTRIDSLEEYINALKAIKKLSDGLKEQKILDYIKTKEKFTDFFSQNQQKEEMLKARLITKDNRWKKEINQAENHWYLDGKIGFLIEFSKNKDTYDLKKFKNCRDKFMKLWNFAREKKENQILLYKALLTKGDYLPKVGSNKTFCSFDAGIRAKSENWHRVFESDNKEHLKNLLDDLNLTNTIENELKNIVKVGAINWRKYFIENSDYIKYCENLQLRFYYSENGKIEKIYLLKRTQMNGRHVELHSWHLFNKCFGLKSESNREVRWKLEGQEPCEPFSYIEYVESTSYEEPYILLSGFKYKLQSEEYDLELKIIYENEEFQFNFVDLKGKDVSDIDIRIDNHEIIKTGTFSMPQENKNCCEWLIKQISKKPIEKR